MTNSETLNNPRWQVIDTESYDNGVIIQDTIRKMNFCRLMEGGMGVRTSTVKLAQDVCDWLNETGRKFER